MACAAVLERSNTPAATSPAASVHSTSSARDRSRSQANTHVAWGIFRRLKISANAALISSAVARSFLPLTLLSLICLRHRGPLHRVAPAIAVVDGPTAGARSRQLVRPIGISPVAVTLRVLIVSLRLLPVEFRLTTPSKPV